MSKLERLLNLTAVLLDTQRPLTAEEIRTRVEGYPPPGTAFRRAFERDKDDLRVLGIPLRIEQTPEIDPPIDAYRIPPEEYYLPDPGLDADELAALHLASLAVRLDGLSDEPDRSDDGLKDALWKLGGQADPSPAPVANAVASLPSDPNLLPLFTAITNRHLVRFSYRSPTSPGPGEERTVEPWRLDFQRGRWYLTGYDRLRSGERNYRLERIAEAVDVLRDEPRFERRAPAGAGRRRQGWELGDDAPTMVELLVDESRAAWARQQFGPDVEQRPGPDDGTIFVVAVVNEVAFRSFVLGFLEHAEILDPPAVRQRTIDWLETVAAGGAGFP